METYKDKLFDDLIIKLLTNEITPDEYKILHIWLLEEKNKEYFNKYRSIWQASVRLGGRNKFNAPKGWTNIKNLAGIINENEKNKPTGTLTLFLKIAAAILLLISGTALLTWHITSKNITPQELSEYTSISSPLGSKCSIILPDSTMVWLNAGSKITYPKNFNDYERRLTLVGEAFFDVTSNKEKPFMVQTSDILVRAFGTKFNIKAYPEECKVDIQLLNGKNLSEEIILKPNEKVIYHKKNNQLTGVKSDSEYSFDSTNSKLNNIKKTESIEINSNIKTELYTSWKDRRWIIEGENLENFAKILERRYNITIVFANNELKAVKFTGIIENETIEQIMEALRLTSPLTFEMSKDTIWLNLDKQLEKKYRRFNIIKQTP